MNISDFIGDLKGYAKCDKCDHTMWKHSDGSYILYHTDGKITKYCSRCGRIAGFGRLYKEDFTTNWLLPANKEAYDCEVRRAGKQFALYKSPEEVPLVE